MNRIRPKDVRDLTDEELDKFSLYNQESLNQVKFQIEDAEAHGSGHYDPAWMAKALYTKRSKGLLQQVVLRETADRAKVKREAKNKDQQFLIIKEVKEILGHERFQQILTKLGFASEDS